MTFEWERSAIDEYTEIVVDGRRGAGHVTVDRERGKVEWYAVFDHRGDEESLADGWVCCVRDTDEDSLKASLAAAKRQVEAFLTAAPP